MKAQGTPNKYEVIPEGTYKGRVFFIVDLGTQKEKGFKGDEKITHKVRIAFEFPTELMKDGRPFAVGRDYNMNLGSCPRPGKPAPNFGNPLLDVIRALTGFPCPTNLDGYYEFDLDKLMGKCAMFQIIHNENGNAKIKGCFQMEKGAQMPSPVNPPTLLSLDPSEFNVKVFDGLSDFWKKMIVQSPEGNAVVNGRPFDAGKAAQTDADGTGEEAHGQGDDAPFPDEDPIPF